MNTDVCSDVTLDIICVYKHYKVPEKNCNGCYYVNEHGFVGHVREVIRAIKNDIGN
ncbi:MAG: hypothetical protein ABJP45_03605 [Cyclobacteriaceae bacterium]